MAEIDTLNKFLVSLSLLEGGRLVIMRPPAWLSADDALLLAAYLVSMASALSPTHPFEAVLAAVQAT